MGSDGNGFDTARSVELEVLLLRRRDLEPLAPKLTGPRAAIKSTGNKVSNKVTSSLWPSFWSVTQLVGMSSLAVAAVWQFQLRYGQTRAERELARMVAIL